MDDGPQCTCEKSGCLQRYCHCFAARYYCAVECSCQTCRNTEDNADEVEEKAESILKKKPDAFKPKVTTGAGDVSGLPPQQLLLLQEEARVHVKGCNCRKSECKKLYCECFKHRVGCSAKCQCTACANKFGVKGAAETDTDSPSETSGGSGATLAGSDADDHMFNVPADQAIMLDVLSPIPVVPGDWTDWCLDLVPRTRAMGDGGLEVMFQKFKDGDNFHHNVDPQTHQRFAQADVSPTDNANSMQQPGPSNSDTCGLSHGSQIKHRVGCSAKCQCRACANKFGVKGAAETDTDSPTGTSGGSGATLAGSDGVSSTFADDHMFNVPAEQAIMVDVFSPIPIPGNWTDSCLNLVPRTRAMGGGGLEAMFQQFNDGDNFQHNVDPQAHQGFAQADVSPADNTDSDTCHLSHGSQINKFGGI